jgi:hypothetical protein
MSTRIYVVSDSTEAGGQHLVRAASPAAAIRHVVRERYKAAVAAQETIVELLTAGQRVEDATSVQAEIEA